MCVVTPFIWLATFAWYWGVRFIWNDGKHLVLYTVS